MDPQTYLEVGIQGLAHPVHKVGLHNLQISDVKKYSTALSECD